MNALWTASEAASATGGKAFGNWEAQGISIDTRTLEKDDLFVALKGDNRDGHCFVPSALEKGAGAAMVIDPPPGLAESAPLLVVDDTLSGLEALGCASRARSLASILAVTGSAGKTTTKEMLRLTLEGQGKVAASVASYNNHWGVPLSLARMARDTAYGVFEIGMNHEGEIRALVSQARPHLVVVTTIAPAHLEYFGTLEAIADSKAEIFEGLEPGGIAILPLDNPQFARLNKRARECGVENIASFGTSEGADARLLVSKIVGDKQIIAAEIRGRKIELTLNAHGAHIASNALAVLLAVEGLGVDLERAAQALGTFTPLTGRGARVTLGDIELIDESYNANPASMRAALDLLKATNPQSGGRRIAVLGEMLELGTDGPALHCAIAKDIAENMVDLVFLCGSQMKDLWDVLPGDCRGAYSENSMHLKEPFLKQLRSGDIILVKGSFGSRMSVIIEALKSRAVVETA
jgi:UDP-N-acetylmuramoyl-tripeptide--D-alanyl-D-alanine ligase